jgi:hypothetical protein
MRAAHRARARLLACDLIAPHSAGEMASQCGTGSIATDAVIVLQVSDHE